MTQSEQDAVMGRLLREKKEAEAKQVALEAEAESIAIALHALAQNVEKRLRGIYIEGSALDTEFVPWAAKVVPADLEEPKRIIPLANEYRETLTKLRKVSQQLKQAGYE